MIDREYTLIRRSDMDINRFTLEHKLLGGHRWSSLVEIIK
jgi:hypothetical protein